MARRKSAVRAERRPASTPAGEMPERLRRCTVEDWVERDEAAPWWVTPGQTGWRVFAAWRRWKAARAAWIRENDPDCPPDEMGHRYPMSSPRIRGDWGWDF